MTTSKMIGTKDKPEQLHEIVECFERHTFTLLGVATLLIEKSNIIDHNEKLQEKLDDLIDKIADDAEELNDITQQLRKSFPNEGLKLSCPL